MLPTQRLLFAVHSSGLFRGLENGNGNPRWARRVRGPLDPDRLRSAQERVLGSHGALRASLVQGDDGPMQRVWDRVEARFTFEDLSGIAFEQRADALNELTTAHCGTPFPPARPENLRVLVIRLASDDHIVWAVASHLFVDGNSLAVLMAELSEGYEVDANDDVDAADTETDAYLRYARSVAAATQSVEATRAAAQRLVDQLDSVSNVRLPVVDPIDRKLRVAHRLATWVDRPLGRRVVGRLARLALGLPPSVRTRLADRQVWGRNPAARSAPAVEPPVDALPASYERVELELDDLERLRAAASSTIPSVLTTLTLTSLACWLEQDHLFGVEILGGRLDPDARQLVGDFADWLVVSADIGRAPTFVLADKQVQSQLFTSFRRGGYFSQIGSLERLLTEAPGFVTRAARIVTDPRKFVPLINIDPRGTYLLSGRDAAAQTTTELEWGPVGRLADDFALGVAPMMTVDLESSPTMRRNLSFVSYVFEGAHLVCNWEVGWGPARASTEEFQHFVRTLPLFAAALAADPNRPLRSVWRAIGGPALGGGPLPEGNEPRLSDSGVAG